MSKKVLQVIVGSTRPGRVGRAIADWFAAQATDHGEFQVEIVDLAEINLPILDEPNHPKLKNYVHEHTKAWSAIIDRADAYAFVIPEYNYSLNGATKNAIDFLFHEWAYKPLGVISYGGVSGGLRAAQQLKQIGSALKMSVTPDLVTIPMVGPLMDEEHNFNALPIMDDSATMLLNEMTLLANALEFARNSVVAAQ